MFKFIRMRHSPSIFVPTATLIAVCLALAGGAVAQGPDGHRVYFVAPDGETGEATPNFSSIQAAVDAVDDPGDIVKVAAGTYSDVQLVDVMKQIVAITKSLTLRGGYSATNWQKYDPEANDTVLDAGGLGRGITCNGHGISVRIEGLRITGGSATAASDGHGPFGGGVFIDDTFTGDGLISDVILADCRIHGNTTGNTNNSKGGGVYAYAAALEVRNCVIENNTAGTSVTGAGGGLYLINNDKTITGCTVRGNSIGGSGASHGGGVYLMVGYSTVERMELSDNTFESNSTRGEGGGVYIGTYGVIDWVALDISSNQFIGNSTTEYGGGLRIDNNIFTLALTFKSNLFRDNMADISGGGVYLGDWINLTADRNTFRHNSAGAMGGGIYVGLCEGHIDNTLVADNTLSVTDAKGTGICVWRGNGPSFRHTTIANNDAAGTLDCAVFSEDSEVSFTNSIMANQPVAFESSNAGLGTTALPIVSQTLFDTVTTQFGGLGAIDAGSLTGSAAFIDATNADISARDYHITADSAAKDVGASTTVEDDIDQQVRPIGPAADLGTDEYGSVSADMSLDIVRTGTGIVSAGARILFDLTLENTEGPGTAGGRVLCTVTPETAIGEVSTDLPAGQSTFTRNTAKFTVMGITVGTARTVQLAVTPRSGYEGTITVTPVLTTLGALDGNSANNAPAPVTVTVAQGPPFSDLWVSATGPSYSVPNAEYSYEIVCRNGGVLSADAAKLKNTLPAKATFLSATDNFTRSGQTITWNLGALAPGTTVSRSISVRVAADAAGDSVLTNTATIAADAPTDPSEDNVVTTDTTIYTGSAEMFVETRPGFYRWYPRGDRNAGTIEGVYVQDFLTVFQYLATSTPAPQAASFTLRDDLPAELTLRDAFWGIPLTYSLTDHSITWHNVDAMNSGDWGWARAAGSWVNPPAGFNLTNRVRLDYTLDTTQTGFKTHSADTQVPIFPPIITFPEPGFVAANEVGLLEAKGFAQPNVTVRIFEDDALAATTTADDKGQWELAYSSGLNTATIVWVSAQAQLNGQESERCKSVGVQESRGWCPQRSYWEGSVKTGPLTGQNFKFRFRGEDGTFATPPMIQGVYGWMDTEMHLYTLCAPAKATCDGVTYYEETPKPEEGRWRTIKITGGAHGFDLNFQCGGGEGEGGDDYDTDGQVLIDPDGYVFDGTQGIASVIKNATVTCMWYNPQWGGWVAWPAQFYENQKNPQVTGDNGYFAFFTPPGSYYIDVLPESGFQPWRSPVVQVVSEIVHVNVPATPSADHSTQAVRVTPATIDRDTLSIHTGDTVEWVSTLGDAGAADVIKFTADPVVQILSTLDPLSDTKGFDSGLLAPGQNYRRTFSAPGTYTYSTGTGKSGTVIVQAGGVPNVVGKPRAQAESDIVAAGFTVGVVTEAFSGTVASGSVISQNPAAGTGAAPGSAVALVLSKGPESVKQITVPNVVGQTQATAETALTTAGLAVGVVTQSFSETVAAGNVMSQNPAAGTTAAPGTAVALVVSKGPEPAQQVTVPDVVGQTQTAAEAAITSAGLTTGTVTEAYSDEIAAGNVLSHTPAAGASVAPGTAVALVISKGPEDKPSGCSGCAAGTLGQSGKGNSLPGTLGDTLAVGLTLLGLAAIRRHGAKTGALRPQ